MKVGVVTPARDIVHTGYAFDAMNMLAYTAATRPDIVLGSYTSLGTMIFDQRIKLARECLQEGCDYILWLDSDMRFPKDTLLRLLSYQRDIVAANYVTRHVPPEPISFQLVEEGQRWARVPTTRDDHGLAKVCATGMGVMMVSARVFKKIDDPNQPMFWFQYSTKNHTTLGEDIYFCVNATRHGFDIWIDHDLSKQVRHIGTFEFGHEHCDDAMVADLVRALKAAEVTDINQEAPLPAAAE